MMTTILLTVIFSIFSTIVMSYISMATPIGPWIGPTLVLLALLIKRYVFTVIQERDIAYSVAGGSVGGILATAFGFSFPTLYFLDQNLFNEWMQEPFYFISILSCLALCSGWLGIWVANVFEKKYIVEEQLAFPIGQLTYKMIGAQAQVKKAYELMMGFFSTIVFCIFQNGMYFLPRLLPRFITVFSKMNIGFFRIPSLVLRLDLLPMFLAIGFVTGHVIAGPLAVGAVAKIFLADPVHNLFFTYLSNVEFVLAFCSGIVLSSALFGFFGLSKRILNGIRDQLYNKNTQLGFSFLSFFSAQHLIELGAICVLFVLFLTYFHFTFISQFFLILFSLICGYIIASIAGKTGLALLGRFATFVMVPAIMLFRLNYVQMVIVATCVELVGGVATDILFGRKMGHLGNLDIKKLKYYQYFGLVISSLSVGIVFWVLINHFSLGSEELFAYRAQSRQLLIATQQFNFFVLIIGVAFGTILKYIKLNPMLVLGGLLMPVQLTMSLVLGGIIALLVKKPEEWHAFWSGVFAGNSIWMIMRALL